MSEMIERVARALAASDDAKFEHNPAVYEALSKVAINVIAEWLETQRTDVPAHGWEFAAVLKES